MKNKKDKNAKLTADALQQCLLDYGNELLMMLIAFSVWHTNGFWMAFIAWAAAKAFQIIVIVMLVVNNKDAQPILKTALRQEIDINSKEVKKIILGIRSTALEIDIVLNLLIISCLKFM